MFYPAARNLVFRSATMPPKKGLKNKDNCLACKLTCKTVASNTKGGICCSVCQYWYHPECAGVSEEEFRMCLKWKDLKGTDIWTCSPCESANENLDKRVKEVNAKVEEVKKDLKEIGDKQDQAEIREQLRDTKVDTQAAEITALKERMALLEANSGDKVLREVEERKTKETNLVFYRIPEVEEERGEVRREEDEKRVRFSLKEIGASQMGIKFSRRIGEKLGGQGPRPLLVGFDSVQTTEDILEKCPKLSKSTHAGLREVTVVRDLTLKQRKDEQGKLADIKKKNLTRTTDEMSKNLFYKLVGKRGSKREILAPLLPGEVMDKDGLVVREGRAAKEVQVTGSNSVPVASVRVPLNLTMDNSGEERDPIMEQQQQVNRQEKQVMPEQDITEEIESSLLLQRSSPGGQLGTQVTASGRRPSVSQEQWTPASKRKSRGSKGSPGSPVNKDKRSKEDNWVWGANMTTK